MVLSVLHKSSVRSLLKGPFSLKHVQTQRDRGLVKAEEETIRTPQPELVKVQAESSVPVLLTPGQ